MGLICFTWSLIRDAPHKPPSPVSNMTCHGQLFFVVLIPFTIFSPFRRGDMAGVPHLFGKSGDSVVVFIVGGFGLKVGISASEYDIWKLNDIGAAQNEHCLVFCILIQETLFVVNELPFSLQKSNRLLLESIRTKLFLWQLIWLSMISIVTTFVVIHIRKWISFVILLKSES